MPSPSPSLVTLVRRVGQRAGELFAGQVDDLTISQLAVLRAIQASPGTSQTAIVSATHIDRSTVAEIVKRLLKGGFVRRRRSREDTRAYVVDLTPAGLEACTSAALALGRVEANLMAAVPEQDRERFIAALERILAADAATA